MGSKSLKAIEASSSLVNGSGIINSNDERVPAKNGSMDLGIERVGKAIGKKPINEAGSIVSGLINVESLKDNSGGVKGIDLSSLIPQQGCKCIGHIGDSNFSLGNRLLLVLLIIFLPLLVRYLQVLCCVLTPYLTIRLKRKWLLARVFCIPGSILLSFLGKLVIPTLLIIRVVPLLSKKKS